MLDNTQARLRPMLFMVFSIACATFFFFLFYLYYWQWIPLYRLFEQEPIVLFFYQDVHALLFIPVIVFLVAAQHFYRQYQSINR